MIPKHSNHKSCDQKNYYITLSVPSHEIPSIFYYTSHTDTHTHSARPNDGRDPDMS